MCQIETDDDCPSIDYPVEWDEVEADDNSDLEEFDSDIDEASELEDYTFDSDLDYTDINFDDYSELDDE